jgi:hypothetical protein
MELLNKLLIGVGDLVHWIWQVLCDGSAWLWHHFDNLANPVLSPVLKVLNPICTAIGDVVFAVLGILPAWLALTLLSAVAGVVMIVLFARLSNQQAIARVKDDIKANLLALKLYKDQMHVTFKAQVNLLWALLRFQRYMLAPLLVLLFPMMLMLAQMGVRYQWRPLEPGEQCLITAKLDESAGDALPVLEPVEGVQVEIDGIPCEGEVQYRVRAEEPGRHELHFQWQEQSFTKELLVGDVGDPVSAEKPASRWTAQVLHPVELPFPSDSVVQSISIDYPGVESYIYGADWWMLYFFVVSMAVAFAAGRILGVKF